MNSIPDEITIAAKKGITILCKSQSQVNEIKRIVAKDKLRAFTLENWLNFKGAKALDSSIIFNKNEIKLIIKEFLKSDKNPIENFNLGKTSNLIYDALLTLKLNQTTSEINTPLEKKLLECTEDFINKFCLDNKASWLATNIKATLETESCELPNTILMYEINPNKEPALIRNAITSLSHKANIRFVSSHNLNVTMPIQTKCITVEEEIDSCINFCIGKAEKNNTTIAITSPIYNEIKILFEKEFLRKKGLLSININDVLNTEQSTSLFNTNIGKQALKIINEIELNEQVSSKEVFQFLLTEIHKNLTAKPLELHSPIDLNIDNKCQNYDTSETTHEAEEQINLTEMFTENEITLDEFESFSEFQIDNYSDKFDEYENEINKEAFEFTAIIDLLAKINTFNITNTLFTKEEIISFYSDEMKKTKVKGKLHHPITFKKIEDIKGLNFDYIWVLGANAENWDNLNKENPLIKEHDNQNNNITEIIKQLKSQCYELIISHSMFNEDAPLLPPIEIDKYAEFSPKKNKYEVRKKQLINIEKVCDTYTNEHSFDHQNPCTVEFINQFKQCPFRANINASIKNGNINKWQSKRHKIITESLALFWRKFRGSINAKKYDTDYLTRTAIKIIQDTTQKRLKDEDEWYIENEKQIITIAILQNINKDLKRRFMLTSNQSAFTVELDGKFLKIPVDRVELAEEKETYRKFKHNVCISEKEMIKSASQGINITDFLLPALTLLPNVKAISQLEINAFANTYNTISDENSKIPNSLDGRLQNKTYSELCETWKGEIKSALTNLQSGFSINRPDKVATCRNCKYKAVCRINEDT